MFLPSCHQVYSTLLISKNDHILETSPRTTIFWRPSLDKTQYSAPSTSTPSSFLRFVWTQLRIHGGGKFYDSPQHKWESTWPFLIYLAIFTYLPGRFFLSTWPFFVSTWLHPPRIQPQLLQHIVHRRRFRHYNTIQYLDLLDIVPLQYSTWTCRIHLPSTLLLAFSQYFSNRPLHCLTKLS